MKKNIDDINKQLAEFRKKEKDLNIPESYNKLVTLAEKDLLTFKQTEEQNIKRIKTIIENTVFGRAGVMSRGHVLPIIFQPNIDECQKLVEEAKKKLLIYEALCKLIVFLRENNLQMPQCFEQFINSVLLGEIKKPKKASQTENWGKKATVMFMIKTYKDMGYYPVTRNDEYKGKKSKYKGNKSVSDAIEEANDKVKAYYSLSFRAIKKIYFEMKNIFDIYEKNYHEMEKKPEFQKIIEKNYHDK